MKWKYTVSLSSATVSQLAEQYVFDVHGSVHLGNIYVQFKVQLDVFFMYSIFYLHSKHVELRIKNT
jgi:hypothetical protein